MKIRYEIEKDQNSIRELNVCAFPTDAEANLVDLLRSKTDCISLVAESDGLIVGHILFSPTSSNEIDGISIAGLAPMAVLPNKQRNGVGSLLIKQGIDECVNKGYDAIVVLGHSEYYPKFGFVPSVKYNIKSEYDVPDEVFMIQELRQGVLENVNGIVKYHEAFNSI